MTAACYTCYACGHEAHTLRCTHIDRNGAWCACPLDMPLPAPPSGASSIYYKPGVFENILRVILDMPSDASLGEIVDKVNAMQRAELGEDRTDAPHRRARPSRNSKHRP